MAESIALWCKERRRLESLSNGELVKDTTQLVAKLELADGRIIESYWNHAPGLQSAKEPHRVTLHWPDDKAGRFVEFFERYMVRPPDECPPVNCHHLVAAVMGWEVFWQEGYPYNMPASGQADPDHFENGQPYALQVGDQLVHSVLGTADPARNISIWGYGEYMLIASNEVTAAHYGSDTWLHHTPQELTAPEKLEAQAKGFAPFM